MSISALLVVAAGVFSLPGLIGSTRLGLLSVGSWFYREPRPDARREMRVVRYLSARINRQVQRED